MSLVVFTLVIETLATVIWQNSEIKEIEISSNMHKLLFYADAAAFVLQEPLVSFQVLNVLAQFGKVCGYQ